MIRIGIDIGGTFTDFVIYYPENGSLSTFKLPSTPHNPAEAVLQGLKIIGDLNNVTIIHGSTVATNALLERKGARTALVATKGFKDIIQIGRQNRPSLYDLFLDPPDPLIPAELRFEIDERVEHTGKISKPIDKNEVENLANSIKTHHPEAVAISFLFSYLHPEHEKIIAEELRKEGYFISCSSEVLPEFREYERSSTTVINAYVSPKLAYYLTSLQSNLPSANLQVMQSNGGMINIVEAEQYGVRCILSGPAGGIVGASYIAHRVQQATGASTTHIKTITFDMGGTSTDISLIDGKPKLTKESIVGGMPIALPLLDINTIGAGGGSIAKVDPGHVLRVGPQSAGAHPGPACYGIGNLPTVTDANLVLGRILPDHFLGGKIKLDTERASQSLKRLGDTLGLSMYEAALGVIEVVNAQMERALRISSVEKGYDPREFSLLTFGGAGGLHATDLAHRISVYLVIIPPLASTLSAFGMLAADFIKDYVQTVMLSGDANPEILSHTLESLIRYGLIDMRTSGILDEQILIEPSVDMRYTGQSYELNIPFSQTLESDFATYHQKTYGYMRANAHTEIVNVRVRVIGKVEKPNIPEQPYQGSDPSSAFLVKYPVFFPDGKLNVPFYRGEMLKAGNLINGPAIILRSDTTILLGKQDSAEVDRSLNLLIRTQ